MGNLPLFALRMKQFEMRDGGIYPLREVRGLPFVTISSIPKEVTLGRATEDSDPMINLPFEAVSRSHGILYFNEINNENGEVVYAHQGRVPAQIRWGNNLCECLNVLQGEFASISPYKGRFTSSSTTPESLQLMQPGHVLRYSTTHQQFLDIEIVKIA